MEYLKKYEQIELLDYCYIYPNGGCAEILLRILKEVYNNVEFRVIDDGKKESSLQNNLEEIKSSQKYILLMGGDIYGELEAKCVKFGITRLIDAREYVAFLLGREILALSVGGGADLSCWRIEFCIFLKISGLNIIIISMIFLHIIAQK